MSKPETRPSGITIPGYSVQKKLNESFLFQIYIGTKLDDDTEVIIKTLKSKYPSKEDLAAIKSEYLLHLKLSGNVAPEMIALVNLEFGNVGMISHRFGISLKDFLASFEKQRLPLDTFYEIALGLIDLLSEVHQLGVIHKDINPSNVLVDPESLKVKLIDFGLSTELHSEHQELNQSTMIEGTLSYLAPEQTGRMNRSVDYRSDYYSLGITLFELLYGNPPFISAVALEIVHFHISKQPPLLCDLISSVPRSLAEIINKLLSKNAEDRYQSSFGLKHDLEKSRQSKNEAVFPLGIEDVSRKLNIPQKLYGREQEMEILEYYFTKCVGGAVEFCCVEGYSGVGKTALVNELTRTITKKKGLLVSGKFGQYKQNSSYAAIIQAFEELIHQLLGETQETLLEWKRKILAVLYDQAQVIIDVIPELEIIIGPQPTVQELTPVENQNRFLLLFKNFIGVFASEEHPLVIFLDDLQWSDTPSLELINAIVLGSELSHCFLIGTYRDNEVDDVHPLSMRLKAIKSKRRVGFITLKSLDINATKALIADALSTSKNKVQELSNILVDKSGGNPFFTIELLKTLYEQNTIFFDDNSGKWGWNLSELKNLDYSDNVVDILVLNIGKLENSTQNVLQLAASIGAVFDLKTLSVVYQQPPSTTANHLKAALQENLVYAFDNSYRYAELLEDIDAHHISDKDSGFNPHYRFQHDRVQQAAYSLIKEEDKPELHLSIGRVMLNTLNEKEQKESILDIVSHLNKGVSHSDDSAELLTFSELNLQAGIKAIHSSAYQEALYYLQKGWEQLGEEKWTRDFDLSWNLAKHLQRCFYLTADLTNADAWSDEMLLHAKSRIEKALVFVDRTRQYSTTGRMKESVDAAYKGLQYLDFSIVENPTKDDVASLHAKVNAKLEGKEIKNLIALRPMTDKVALIAAQLYMEVFAAAFLSGSGEKFPHLVLSSVDLAIDYGSCPSSAFNFSAYGMLLCGFLNQPALGNEFGKLGIEMIERYDEVSLKSRTYYVYTMFVSHWSNHWSTMTPLFKKGIESGYRSGDLLYLAYSAQDCIIWDPKINLEHSAKEHKRLLQIVKDCEYQDSYDSGMLFYQMQQNFLGHTQGRFSMTTDDFDEATCVKGMRSRDFMTGIANYNIYKCEIHLLYNDYKEIWNLVTQQEELKASSMSLPQQARFSIVSYLLYALKLHEEPLEENTYLLPLMEEKLKEMTLWAAVCEDNFEHLRLFMEAEKIALEGKRLAAILIYDKAISFAHKHQFRRDEAMISEFAARNLIRLGLTKPALGYLNSSLHTYYNWGANNKVDHLLETYPKYLEKPDSIKSRMTIAGDNIGKISASISTESLDIESLFKASQQISGQLELDKLLTSTLDILIENAGAEKGCIIEKRKGDISMTASVNIDSTSEHHSLFPSSLVNAVFRKKETMVIDDLSKSKIFYSDPYILEYQPKSAMCIPIYAKGDNQVVIYLENNLAHSAFNEGRIRFIKLLASQATVSIENATLYEQRENLLKAQQRFVPKQFLKHLGHKDISKVILGEAVVMNMSVLFSDIRNFTPIVESMSPDEVIQLLNRYYTKLGVPISEHGGFIDSFAGDQIMALFAENHVNAVKAGIAMCRALEDFNQKSINPKINMGMGIGVNSGQLVLGTMGGKDRIQCTVLGDTVNLAARLESLTKHYDSQFLIGESTYNQVVHEKAFSFRMVDYAAVKGKKTAVKLYEVLEAESSERKEMKMSTQHVLKEGIEKYQKRAFTEALELFKEGEHRDPLDRIFKLYIERTQNYLENPPPDDWEGYDKLHKK